jgi:N-acetylglucosaminyl-diphospho-decaprenol L-rhamnosyltransferase
MSDTPSEPVPDITVVVVNFNGGDYLKGCIASLARQTHRNFETIIIDNNSADDSLARLTEKPARLTILKQSENLGFARANNIGAAAGRGAWLALLNPDAEAEPAGSMR